MAGGHVARARGMQSGTRDGRHAAARADRSRREFGGSPCCRSRPRRSRGDREREPGSRAARRAARRHRDARGRDRHGRVPATGSSSTTSRSARRSISSTARCGRRRRPKRVAVGKLVRVDAVVRGEVKVFDERIGTELAAKRPAHVIFAARARAHLGRRLGLAGRVRRAAAVALREPLEPARIRAGGRDLGPRRRARRARREPRSSAACTHALYGPPPKKTSTKRKR